MKPAVEIVKATPAPIVATEEPSVASMLQAAISSGVTPDGLEKLVSLYERMDARRAEREFAGAMQLFQRRCPVVFRNRMVDAGRLKYRFTSLDHLAETIRPVLEECGLSYSFDTAITEKAVTVSTVLRHVGGHKEISTFSAPIDGTTAMNAPQKVASATSYARRYGLMLALGITTGDEDDDARTAGADTAPITDEQVAKLIEMIESVEADRDRFLAFMGVGSLADISQRDYERAVRALRQKGARR